jgi:hypothetical protein
MNLPSEISFVSLLQYSPRGSEELAKQSRFVRDAIKRDSYIRVQGADDTSFREVRAIEYFADLTRTLIEQYSDKLPCLAQAFGAEVVLIPMPGSAPLVNKSALWSPMSICRAFKNVGLAGEVLPILERTQAVQKSAWAVRGARPDPEDHYRSTAVTGPKALPMFGARKVTLVDDFVTRGSTFLGVYRHIEAAFPGWSIECFALVRTQSYETLDHIVAPVNGTITFHNRQLRRDP